MTDFRLNHFEETDWDDFYFTDAQSTDDHLIRGHNNLKKRWHQQRKNSCNSNEDDEDEWGILTLGKRRNVMSEKHSWTHMQSTLLPSSADSNRTATLSSDNSSPSPRAFESCDLEKGGNDFCANERSILDDKGTAVHNDSFSYLDDINDAVDNIGFFEIGCKDASDLLSYGWPDIGDFEDADKMFRSCDSTFGVGLSTEVEADLFPTICNLIGSEELMKSGLESLFPESNIADDVLVNHHSLKSDSVNGNPLRNVLVETRDSTWTVDKSDSFRCVVDRLVMDAADDFLPIEQLQINEQGKECNPKKHTMVTGKDHEVKNDPRYANSLPNGNTGQACNAPYCQQFPVSVNQNPDEASAPSPCHYFLYSVSFSESDKIPISSEAEIDPTKADVGSGNHGVNPCSPIDSSPASILSRKKETSHVPRCYDLSGGEKLRTEVYIGLNGKQNLYSGIKCENHTDKIGVDHATIPETGSSSNSRQGLSSSPAVDNISFDASSFHQLQRVMDTLDVRTKLCIRDSLYRLAYSAEQRNNYAKSNSHHGDDNGTSTSVISDETTSCLINIERDTNPVDRSVAHLLFHRPPKSSPPVVRRHSTLPLNLSGTIHGHA